MVWRPQPQIPRSFRPAGASRLASWPVPWTATGRRSLGSLNLRLMPAFLLARAILGTAEEAEDAVQEAFISAWRALPTLHDPDRFDAWFSRIVVNACRMAMRRRPRVTVIPIDAVAADRMDDKASLDGVVDVEALHCALDGLPIQSPAPRPPPPHRGRDA